MSKRTYEDAFERRFLNKVDKGDFYVKIDMFKVLNIKNRSTESYEIRTTENNEFSYGGNVIMQRSKSATAFNRVETFTKTELIELFACISINDVWSAEYLTFDKTKEWPINLTKTIQKLPVDDAVKYIKQNFGSFGKVSRSIIGHKVNPVSDNNYYTVRDLAVHFELLEGGKSVDIAHNQSIRKLDVNSIQFLIFNGVKYELKTFK